jgi:hypothetical protein
MYFNTHDLKMAVEINAQKRKRYNRKSIPSHQNSRGQVIAIVF